MHVGKLKKYADWTGQTCLIDFTNPVGVLGEVNDNETE
jgi:hypothetical protein